MLAYDEDSKSKETLVALILTITLGISPLLISIFLLCFKERLKDESFTTTWGVLYQHLDLKNPKQRILTILYNFFFVIRRLFYALCIVFGGINSIMAGFFQNLIQMLMSLFQLMYLLSCWRFEEKNDNYIEIFNETCVLMMFTAVLPYTDELDAEDGSKLGFALIGLILFNILINVALFLYTNVKLINLNVIQPLHKKYLACREKERLKRELAKKYDESMINLENFKTKDKNQFAQQQIEYQNNKLPFYARNFELLSHQNQAENAKPKFFDQDFSNDYAERAKRLQMMKPGNNDDHTKYVHDTIKQHASLQCANEINIEGKNKEADEILARIKIENELNQNSKLPDVFEESQQEEVKIEDPSFSVTNLDYSEKQRLAAPFRLFIQAAKEQEALKHQ